ncbi:MAG: NAD(P)H-dependent oxidoreductase [Pontixanthobacter sp.]
MNDDTPQLIIAWHSRTGTAEALARAAYDGAMDEECGVQNRLITAADVTSDDIRQAGAYLFVCPENLATMSGMMKEMFDRTYYDVLGQIEGRAYATIIAAGSDGEGAQRQIDRIAKGWRLKRVAEPYILNTDAQTPEAIQADKVVLDVALTHARELGAAMAQGCAMGVF